MEIRSVQAISCIGLCCLLYVASCKDDSASPDLCMPDVERAENVFNWKGGTYSTSGSSSDLVICSETEIDAFYNANSSSEITFGFNKLNSEVKVTLKSDGTPVSPILLKDGASTYVAVEGTLVPCHGGYQFSLGFKLLMDSVDLTSTTGSVVTLTGLIKCS